jgi:glycerophosphoryl diester phosphodiesterase
MSQTRSLKPAMRSFPFLAILVFSMALSLSNVLSAADYQGVRIIAHRGAGHEFDENTVAACKQSYERGLRGFEVDIRLTRDDHLVLMHDSDASRTTTGTGKIEEMTLAEVKKLRTKENGVPVPSVEDLFAYFKDKPDVVLLLEMKTTDQSLYRSERLATYCRLLHERTRGFLTRDNYWFTSFDRRSLAEMKRLAPDAYTGLLTATAPTAESIEEAKRLGCGRLSASLDNTSRKLAGDVRKAGLQISLWPIRSREDADLAVMFGASILCTDIPSQLLEKKTATP